MSLAASACAGSISFEPPEDDRPLVSVSRQDGEQTPEARRSHLGYQHPPSCAFEPSPTRQARCIGQPVRPTNRGLNSVGRHMRRRSLRAEKRPASMNSRNTLVMSVHPRRWWWGVGTDGPLFVILVLISFALSRSVHCVAFDRPYTLRAVPSH
ncbi:hypothetical protein OG21DRAFT_218112 [Imleria badia]|nr:hypothetical protein OG21DRAFT_218112 [Imleria badia]